MEDNNVDPLRKGNSDGGGGTGNITVTGVTGSSVTSGVPNVSDKIDRMRTLTKDVRGYFMREKWGILFRGFIWLILTIFLIKYLKCYYDEVNITDEKLVPFYFKLENWKPYYASYRVAIKVTYISLIVSLIVFCLKMIRLYLSLFEQIRHKIAIIDSMPTLVHASENDDIFLSSYNKIVEMLVPVGNAKMSNEEDIKVNGIVDFLKGIVKKDEG